MHKSIKSKKLTQSFDFYTLIITATSAVFSIIILTKHINENVFLVDLKKKFATIGSKEFRLFTDSSNFEEAKQKCQAWEGNYG